VAFVRQLDGFVSLSACRVNLSIGRLVILNKQWRSEDHDQISHFGCFTIDVAGAVNGDGAKVPGAAARLLSIARWGFLEVPLYDRRG